MSEALGYALFFLLEHLLTISGFLLAVVLIARVFQENRRPGGAVAWVLAIVLIPYIGVPLYLLLGGRKLRQRAARKSPLYTAATHAPLDEHPLTHAERVLLASGMPPRRAGHSVSLMFNGEAIFHRLIALLEGARESIHVTTFMLCRQETGRQIVEVLAAKAREGVQVRLLLDGLGCIKTQFGFVNPIRAAGGKVGVFMPVLPLRRKWSANLRNHRKIAVVDGETAMLGGVNLHYHFIGPYPRPDRFLDSAVFLRGPAVADIDEIFARDWHYVTDEIIAPAAPERCAAAAGSSAVQVVASGPDVPEDTFYDVVLSMIMHADERIWMVTPYFVPDDPILKALCLQARMGRDVRLVIPAHSNHYIADLARGPAVRELIDAGARVHAFASAMVHTKMLIFDDTIAVTGSPNLDMRSMYLNYEIALFHYSWNDIEAAVQWMERLMAQADVMRPARAGVVREWAENLSLMISPLL